MKPADHHAAEREAERICEEYPKLIQPCETTYNLARAYLELAKVHDQPTVQELDAIISEALFWSQP